MVFHPSFRISTIVAFLLSIAFLGNLGGPSTSLLVVAADDLECRVSLEFSTAPDEDLDIEDLPVPDVDLLPDAILNLFEEEFEMNVGGDYKMTQNVFKSYELRNAPSTASLEDPSTRRGLWEDDLFDMLPSRPSLSYTNYNEIHIGFCNLCAEDDDSMYINPKRLEGQKLAEEFAKKQQAEMEKAEKEKQKQKEKQKEKQKQNQKQKRKQKQKAPIKFPNWRRNKRRERLYKGLYNRQLTVDHFNEGLTDSDVMLESFPSHETFEEDFCNELRKLHEIFPIFKTSDHCKITFHCRDKGEDGEEDYQDRLEDQELVAYDYRDYDASELINQYGEEAFEGPPLYLITTVNWVQSTSSPCSGTASILFLVLVVVPHRLPYRLC